MPNQKKGKATPKSTPSKATQSPKTRGKAVTPKKGESPKAKPITPTRESRSSASTPSKAVSPTQKKAATPTSTKGSPKQVGKPATKASPKGKVASPKSNKTPPKKVSKRPVVVESESESEDENTEFKAGDLIDAQWEDGLFYSARIVRVNKNKSGNTYNIEFTQDGVPLKNLKRSQIQSYTDDSEGEGEVIHKHKASNDDQEYVEGEEIPLRYDDESVESDSTEQPRAGRKAGRRPSSNKRKREAAPVQAPNAEKKRRLTESLAALNEKQLVSIVKKACYANEEILEALEAYFPEPKVVAKPRAAPKKPAVEKKAPPKSAPKASPPAKKGKAAPKKVGVRKNTRSGNK